MRDSSTKVFYTTGGWSESEGGNALDAVMFEDLRSVSRTYLSRNRLRLGKYLPASGSVMLDFASGPIQYPEYLDYSKSFTKRHCIDLSEQALEEARCKAPEHIETTCGDIRDIKLEPKRYDAIVCIHTLYHIEIEDQIDIVKKLLDSLKDEGILLVVYSNPDCILESLKRLVKSSLKLGSKNTMFTFDRLRCKDFLKAFPDVELIPYRLLSGEDMRRIIPDNRLGALMLRFALKIELMLPVLFCQYYIIRLKST